MITVGTSGLCLLVGLCTLTPTPTWGGPEGEVTPDIGMEDLGHHSTPDQESPQDPNPCGITFHTSTLCSPRGPPHSSATRHELEHLKNLLMATKATLKELELAAALEGNQSRYQDVITEALPSIHGDNLEFQESLENVRRELEAHVAQAHHPQVAEKKEKLQEGIRVVAHMLRLTGLLARSLDDISHHIHIELSRHLQGLDNSTEL